MTTEKLQEGNSLEMNIRQTENKLKDLKKFKRKVNSEEERNNECSFSDVTEIKINFVSVDSYINIERIRKFIDTEIEIVTKELYKLKEDFKEL